MEFVKIEQHGLLSEIILQRSERHNALTGQFLAEIEQAAVQLRSDAETRVVLVRGEGKHFSVGADLKSGIKGESSDKPLLLRRRETEQGFRTLRALKEIHQPTICVLHGVATGGGACIATACDFRIAHPDARLGYGEVKVGIPLMWHALPLCVALVGIARAKRLIMSGELIDADTLLNWGMLDAVDADPLALARSWGEDYAALPPLAVQMIKRSINAVSNGGSEAIMHQDFDQWALAANSSDSAEAIAAFKQKRTGEYKGD